MLMGDDHLVKFLGIPLNQLLEENLIEINVF